MRAEFDCPVCGAADWEEGRGYAYNKADHLRADGDLSDGERLRRRVLFEVFAPGSERVVLRARFCRRCGIAVYAPRPDLADISAKYRFLQRFERSVGGSGTSEAALQMDAARAHRTVEATMRHAPRGSGSVLDFGGGDGKLLAPFLARGLECSLVDYNVEPLPGVEKLGDTLDDVPAERRFDIVLCSHVLEHVAEPAVLVRSLAARLAPDGVLFAEVPLEVWRGIPIARDPVTHVNFFTKPAFEDLFIRSGLRMLEARREIGSYGALRKDVAVVVVANPAPGSHAGGPRDRAAETRRLMRPGLGMRLRHSVRHRRISRMNVGARR